jgi:general secretion pathway protein A
MGHGGCNICYYPYKLRHYLFGELTSTLMYKSFYNLKRNPFELTPDPFFLFPTSRHNEALATLYHGVRGHKGFVVLTGEVGTGKTLLLRCLLQLLRQSNDVAYAYVFNNRLSPVEFLQYIASDFGLPASGRNKGEILFDLSNYVIARGSRKLTTVLVVDEAHHLSADILEEIRLLTNLETTQEKLLQVLLVGQPELNDKLDSAALWQLKQRIAHRSQLAPLDLNETRGYIERRLQLAGASSNGCLVFLPDTIASVYRHSRGVPRLINTLCENALITAYARQKRSVTPEIIEDVAADLRLNVNVAQPPREESPGELNEIDVRRAAKNLLDLYAYLSRLPSRDGESRTPVTIQSQQT